MDDFDSFINKLETIYSDYDSIQEQALKNAATKVIIDAKANCPVKTGALRDSIHYENLSKDSVTITTENRNVDEYASKQEYGYTTEKGNYFPGRYFVTNAMDRNASSRDICNEIINEINNRMK